MKRLPAIIVSCLALFIISCNNEAAKDEAKAATDTAAAVSTEPVASKPAFTPFKVVVIQHKVKNFAKAEAGYFKNDSLRQAAGITHYGLGRLVKDSNMVFVMDKIEDVEKSKAFFSAPKVKAAMSKAGVSSPPGFSYGEVVRENSAPSATNDRVAITHHVKDYDAWLKSFDAKGDSARTANGLTERGIIRDLNDPNTVSVIFEVSNMEKAKARLASPEIKKNMKEAGVDSPPTIRWYREIK